MLHGMLEKTAMCSSFSEGVKKFLGIFFPYTMGTSTVEEVDTQEEEEDKEVIDDYESEVSLNSSTQENEASTNMETSYSDRFGTVRTINKTIDGIQNQESS